MPCTITLTTVPAIHRSAKYGIATEYHLLGPTLATETIVIYRLEDIAPEVKYFGAQIRTRAPDASFSILIRVAKGQRKPAGFDAAYRAGTFGHDAFVRFEKAPLPVGAEP